jgi:hypothetical protein
VARGIDLREREAAAAIPERLLLGELLAGRELRGRRRRPGVEAGRPHGRQSRGDPEEAPAIDADGAQARGQEIQLSVGDLSPHQMPPL